MRRFPHRTPSVFSPSRRAARDESRFRVSWANANSGAFASPFPRTPWTPGRIARRSWNPRWATGIGTDIAAGAVAAAARNAARLGLSDRASFRRADWDTGIVGAFDLILGNPPYIPTSEIDRLEPEVSRWDPRVALDGGADGLDAYRRLAPTVADRLAPGGAAFLEIGAGQEGAVEAIMAAEGFARFVGKADLGGIVRCLGFSQRG